MQDQRSIEDVDVVREILIYSRKTRCQTDKIMDGFQKWYTYTLLYTYIFQSCWMFVWFHSCNAKSIIKTNSFSKSEYFISILYWRIWLLRFFSLVLYWVHNLVGNDGKNAGNFAEGSETLGTSPLYKRLNGYVIMFFISTGFCDWTR